jgi:proteic killer suppression protein
LTLIPLDINTGSRYYLFLIKTFADEFTKQVFVTGKTQDPPAAATRRKFALLDAATTLADLAVVPGNNFEKYQDHRKGQYSMRINKKYRLFFKWDQGHAYDVRLADDH